MTYGVKVGGLVLGILCILIMGFFIVDYFLDLSLLPVSMPKLVIGIFCFSALSIAFCIGLVWYLGIFEKRRSKKNFT